MEGEGLIHIAYFRKLDLENVSVTGKLDCLAKCWTRGGISMKNVRSDAKQETRTGEEPFFSAAI